MYCSVDWELWYCQNKTLFVPWRNNPPVGQRPPLCPGFTITLRHITLGRTPLDEWSDRHRDLYLPTHNTHKRETSMPPGGFRTHNPSKQSAADPRFRRRGYWDRQNKGKYSWKISLGWYMLLMAKCFYYPNYAAHKLIATNLNKMAGRDMFMELLYSENNVDIFKA
jgi:hypothetical protein